MPAAEVEVDVPLVRRLLASQLSARMPHLATAPLSPLAEGWDNVVLRLGDHHVVRMPRRRLGAELVEHEARWVPVVSPGLPLATPLPVFVGVPGEGYPFPWLVCRWVEGAVVADLPLDERSALATDLAGVLVALHAQVAPPDAPANPWRGVALATRDTEVRARILAWPGPVDLREVLLTSWAEGVAAAPHPGPPRWLHGDPHPHNLAQVDGRLSGLIDFGDITGGDPASDLATAWWTFGPADRRRFRRAVDLSGLHDAGVWTRARAWAASFASAMEPGSPLEALGHHTARQLALDDGLPR